MGKLMSAFQTVGFKVKKYSPELLAVAGGVGTVTAIVLACKATTKAGDILEQHKKSIEEVKEVRNSEEFDEEYDERDYKHDLTIVYSKTIVELVKLYGPAILTAAGSLFCMFAAVNILRKRNAALTMACTTIASTFADYRQRVKDRYGEDKEFEIYSGIEEQEEVIVETDKDGNEKTKVKKKKIPSGVSSPFAIVFDESNPNWTGDREIDMCFITNIERYCNDILIARKILTLNQVREAFGLDWVEEGQVFGWVYMKNNQNGDNFVDFRLTKDSKNFLDFMNKKNDFVVLDLNCDGNILEFFPSCNGSRKRIN